MPGWAIVLIIIGSAAVLFVALELFANSSSRHDPYDDHEDWGIGS